MLEFIHRSTCVSLNTSPLSSKNSAPFNPKVYKPVFFKSNLQLIEWEGKERPVCSGTKGPPTQTKVTFTPASLPQVLRQVCARGPWRPPWTLDLGYVLFSGLDGLALGPKKERMASCLPCLPL